MSEQTNDINNFSASQLEKQHNYNNKTHRSKNRYVRLKLFISPLVISLVLPFLPSKTESKPTRHFALLVMFVMPTTTTSMSTKPSLISVNTTPGAERRRASEIVRLAVRTTSQAASIRKCTTSPKVTTLTGCRLSKCVWPEVLRSSIRTHGRLGNVG